MLGSIIGGISSIVGGLINRKDAKNAEQENREREDNFLQRRVADAEKAGINPYYAIGAPAVSYSPVSTGGMGDAVASMGQDLGRAADAVRNPQERESAYVQKLQALHLERGSLENTLLRHQILNENRVAGQPPASPRGSIRPMLAGQGDARVKKVVLENPARTTHMQVGVPYDTNPKFVDADSWQRRYGEPGEWLGGAVNAVADGYHNYMGSEYRWDRSTKRVLRGISRYGKGMSPRSGYKSRYLERR